MNIGANIRAIRESRGLTQMQLADKVNVSQGMIAQIERGTKGCTVALAVDIAKALNSTIDAIIGKGA